MGGEERMNKQFVVCLVVIIIAVICAGCNRQIVDLTYNYNRAVIYSPTGILVEGKVDSWKDYDGEQIQVKINGKTYLTQACNVVLIHD